MDIAIVGTDATVVNQAAAVARQAHPQWDVRVLSDPEQFSACGSPDGVSVVLWDVELGSPARLLASAPDGTVVVAWGSADRHADITAALRAGASRCLPRNEGWHQFLPAMLEQAARSALTARSRADEQRAVDLLSGTHDALSRLLEEAVIVVNQGGLIIQFNPAAERLTGHPSDRVLGSRVSALFETPGPVDVAVASLAAEGEMAAAAARSGGEYRLAEDGAMVWRGRVLHSAPGHLVDVVARCRLVTAPGGKPEGAVIVLTADAATPAAGSRRAPSFELLSATLGVLPVPLAIVTEDGTIVRASPALERLLSWNGGELSGKHLRQVFLFPDGLLSLLAAARDAGGPQVQDETLRTLAGERIACIVTAIPIPAGASPGCLALTFEETGAETPGETQTAPAVTEGLGLLRAVISQVGHGQDLAHVLKATAAGLARVLPVDAVVVVTDDAVTGEPLWGANGIDEAVEGPLARALLCELRRPDRPADGPPVPEFISDAHGLDVPDALRGLYADQRLRSVCHTPLAAGTEIVGALATCCHGIRAHDETLCAFVSAVADHLAGGIARHRLERVSARAMELQGKLLAVSLALNAGNDIDELLELIAHTALDIAGGDHCCVEVLDDDQQFENSYAASGSDAPGSATELRSSPLAWQAVQTGELAIAQPGGPNGATPTGEPFVTVAVPLMLEYSPIGALSVRRRGPAPLDEGEINGLRVLAAQAAVAIHGARLFEVARRRSQHMEVVAAQAWQEEGRARALFEVATAVTERTDLQEILAVVTRSACTEIGFERAQIYLADHENQTLVGKLEARTDVPPAPMTDPPVPLRRDSHSRLAEAALGSAPYMIDLV